ARTHPRRMRGIEASRESRTDFQRDGADPAPDRTLLCGRKGTLERGHGGRRGATPKGCPGGARPRPGIEILELSQLAGRRYRGEANYARAVFALPHADLPSVGSDSDAAGVRMGRDAIDPGAVSLETVELRARASLVDTRRAVGTSAID